jgi:hypothetical protein
MRERPLGRPVRFHKWGNNIGCYGVACRATGVDISLTLMRRAAAAEIASGSGTVDEALVLVPFPLDHPLRHRE